MEHEVYDHFYLAEDRHWWFRARRRILAGLLERTLPGSGLKIADVGCGTGGMLSVLSRWGEVTGVDESPLAREYCARRGFPGILSPKEFQERGDQYDLVTSFDVVEHIPDDAAFLRGLYERLVPGGRLLITVPAYAFLWSSFDEMNHHQRRYSRGEITARVDEAGFTVERSSHFNTWLFPAVAGVRFVEKWSGRGKGNDMDTNAALGRYFKIGPLNGVLESVFASEDGWLKRGNLPFGSSIFVLARKAPA